jgi:Domain of unknown function (DUF4136)
MLNRRDRIIRIPVILLAAGLVAAGAAAQKLKIETHRDEQANFAALKTYIWLPSPPSPKLVAPDAKGDPTLTQEVMGPHIIAAVDRELAARGLTKVESGDADIRVVYYANLSMNMDAAQLGSYYQYTTGWGTLVGTYATTSTEVYERGSIVVDVVSPGSNKAIWRGSVASRINRENNLEKRIARVNEGIASMFAKFPVPPVKR